MILWVFMLVRKYLLIQSFLTEKLPEQDEPPTSKCCWVHTFFRDCNTSHDCKNSMSILRVMCFIVCSAGHPPSPSCAKCWEQRSACSSVVRGDRVRTGRSAGQLFQVLSHESDCALQALPVTRAVAVVGPAQEALLYITPGFHWPVLLTPWINRGINTASGPRGQLKRPREAAADTPLDHLAPPAPPGFSWWGQIFVWERRLAVETLVNWSSVSWG